MTLLPHPRALKLKNTRQNGFPGSTGPPPWPPELSCPISLSPALRRLPPLLLLAMAALPSATLAAWLPDGVLLNALADGHRMTADGVGGAFVVWRDYRSPTQLELWGTRIAGDGTFAPGWPAEGTPICVAHGSNPYPFGAAPDGQGGAFFVWEDFRNSALDIYVQRVMPDGAIAPGWPVNGAQATNSPSGDQEPMLAPAGQ